MSGPLPPIPPPPGTSTGNPGSPNVNRVDTMPTNDSTNTIMTTTNVVRNVVEEINDNLPQLLDSRGGSHVLNVPKFDKDDFTSWKISFRIFLEGLEPYLITTLEEGPYVPLSTLSTLTNPQPKRDTKIAALRLKFNAFKALKVEKLNGAYTWLKCLLNDLECNERANNSIKNDNLAALYGKYNYEEDLIDDIYKPHTQKFTIQASSLKALVSNNFQDSDSDVEEDNRTSNEFMADLNAEYH
ncbi:hypothetical protein Tco_0934515 [Tanacetum coccineum]